MQDPEYRKSLYAGLMSGTSMDGIDVVLADIGNEHCDVLATHKKPYPDALCVQLSNAIKQADNLSVDDICSLDQWVGECFATAASDLFSQAGVDSKSVTAIGSHGQTLRHQPHAQRPFSLQIGDPNIIAARTGVTTVADFRRRDIALGGEGAPLAPAFHQWLFSDARQSRVVVNIGGIANVTVLKTGPNLTTGFDTGPGNTLLDAWIEEAKSVAYDAGGEWAESGSIAPRLLNDLMRDPYLTESPPKSTGLEYFNLDWLRSTTERRELLQSLRAVDVQATLAEFTARSIAEAINQSASDIQRLLVCGGGVHNDYLMTRLRENMRGIPVASTAEHGLHPDWVEATAFAWLAMRTLDNQTGNLPSVTGATGGAVLGGVFFGTS